MAVVGTTLYSGWYTPVIDNTEYVAHMLNDFLEEGGFELPLLYDVVDCTMELGNPVGRAGVVLGQSTVEFELEDVNEDRYMVRIHNWFPIAAQNELFLWRGYWLVVSGIWEQGQLVLIAYQASTYVDVGLDAQLNFQVPELRCLGFTTITENGFVTWWCEVHFASMVAGLALRDDYPINNLIGVGPLPVRLQLSSMISNYFVDMIAVGTRVDDDNNNQGTFLQLELSLHPIMDLPDMPQADIVGRNLITHVGNEISIYYGSRNGVMEFHFRPYMGMV